MIDDDEIDALVAALRATGWDRPTTTTALAEADRAAAEALFGATNARRLAATPRGSRVKLVRTSEVYAVRNSRGWMIGAIEGKRNRPLFQGLTDAERTKVLRFARERGFNVVEYDNARPPSLPEYVPPRLVARPMADTGRHASNPSTPSAHLQPSRRHDILQQLGKFRA